MKYKKIYFVGIKGVGMASLAIIAKEGGFEVGGSDIEEEFITDEILRKNHIDPLIGFSAQHIETFVGSLKREEVLVISTSAHGGFENPETKYAREHGFKVLTHGQAVGGFMKGDIFGRKDMEGVSVAGAHGKTTISAMLATLFTHLGFDPSYTVGTSQIFPIGNPGHYGKGNYFIAEADEYVSEINFDRTPKFLYQHPKVQIINNIDFDHPDFYKDITEVNDAFIKFVQNLDEDGVLILNGDDARCKNLGQYVPKSTRVITYGTSVGNDFYISKYYQNGLVSQFSVEVKDIHLGEFELSIPGYHNAKNALSAISLLLEFGMSFDKIKRALKEFYGTKRRIEIVGKTEGGVLLIDDYGHHPQEIKTTLSAIKTAYPKKNIICIFQPHTYSRTKALFYDFVSSFADAYFIVILPIYASLREKDTASFSSEKFIDEFHKINKQCIFLNSQESVIEYVRDLAKSGDFVVVTMGAGDVYKINEKLKVKS